MFSPFSVGWSLEYPYFHLFHLSVCLYVGWSLEYPYFHFFRLSVCLFVCMSVCNGQLWRPEESTDFDETWHVGSYQDLVLCFWAPLLWTPPLPSNGTLKFLKNPKIFIFSKIKNRLPGFYAHYKQPLCQNISAQSVKNCMTSMQLYSDHPCRLPACLCVCLSVRQSNKIENHSKQETHSF